MEDWTAATDEPKKFSQQRIKGCDLCVLLVAFRRGHVPKRGKLSITQLEHRKAKSLGIDISGLSPEKLPFTMEPSRLRKRSVASRFLFEPELSRNGFP